VTRTLWLTPRLTRTHALTLPDFASDLAARLPDLVSARSSSLFHSAPNAGTVTSSTSGVAPASLLASVLLGNGRYLLECKLSHISE